MKNLFLILVSISTYNTSLAFAQNNISNDDIASLKADIMASKFKVEYSCMKFISDYPDVYNSLSDDTVSFNNDYMSTFEAAYKDDQCLVPQYILERKVPYALSAAQGRGQGIFNIDLDYSLAQNTITIYSDHQVVKNHLTRCTGVTNPIIGVPYTATLNEYECVIKRRQLENKDIIALLKNSGIKFLFGGNRKYLDQEGRPLSLETDLPYIAE